MNAALGDSMGRAQWLIQVIDPDREVVSISSDLLHSQRFIHCQS
jgi:hypothetical protein